MKAAADSASEETEGSYGVERTEDGLVSIKLGHIPPFEIPPDTAVKLALLLLQAAGAVIEGERGSTVVSYVDSNRRKPIDEILRDYEKRQRKLNALQ